MNRTVRVWWIVVAVCGLIGLLINWIWKSDGWFVLIPVLIAIVVWAPALIAWTLWLAAKKQVRWGWAISGLAFAALCWVVGAYSASTVTAIKVRLRFDGLRDVAERNIGRARQGQDPVELDPGDVELADVYSAYAVWVDGQKAVRFDFPSGPTLEPLWATREPLGEGGYQKGGFYWTLGERAQGE